MFKIDQISLPHNTERKVVPEDCSYVNLIVGENNTGKTTMLREIDYEVRMQHPNPPGCKWTYGMKLSAEISKSQLDQIFPTLFENQDFCNYDKISQRIFHLKDERKKGITWNNEVFEDLKTITSRKLEMEFEYGAMWTHKEHQSLFSFLHTIALKTEYCENRLDAVFETDIPYFNAATDDNFVFHLYKNPHLFEKIKKNIKEVYRLDLEFDNVMQGHKSIRIVDRKINKTIKDQGRLIREWESKSHGMDTLGHGIRSYLKLIFTVLDPKNRILLIDEPEMLIHPPQRRALGKLIARLAWEEKKQIFVATHDAEFIRGILSHKLEQTKVFRLYISDQGKRQYVTINGSDIGSMLDKKASNILNERIINSYFYSKTVLCEDENDRVFYEEVTSQYYWSKFHDTNFIGLNGKNEVVKIFDKLKEMKINGAMILDIDYLVEGNFPNSLEDLPIYELFQHLRSKLIYLKDTGGMNEFKKKGIGLFAKNAQRNLKRDIIKVLESLKAFDIYVVPKGEMESWTRCLKNDVPTAIKKIRERKVGPIARFMGEILAK